MKFYKKLSGNLSAGIETFADAFHRAHDDDMQQRMLQILKRFMLLRIKGNPKCQNSN